MAQCGTVDAVKCFTKFCRGLTLKSYHSPYCQKCKARRWKAKHPISYYYHKLRTSARRRGKVFTLTKVKFTELWNAGLHLHGRTANAMSVNRIDNSRGYEDDNVEIKTVSENARLRFVPYYKNGGPSPEEISETERAVAAAYPV